MSNLHSIVHADALYLKGNHGEAFDLYRREAVENQNADAAQRLGYLYWKGVFVEPNAELARGYFAMASCRDGDAEYNLALMAMRGEGGEPDFRASRTYMTKSAELGCIHAQLYLGFATMMGYWFDPVEIDCLSPIPFPHVQKKEIVQYYLGQAASQNGLEDERFEILRDSVDDAEEYFKQAMCSHKENPYAESAVRDAKLMYGKLQVESGGALENKEEGYRLLAEVAIEDNHPEALEFLAAHEEEASDWIERVRGRLQKKYKSPFCVDRLQGKIQALLAAAKKNPPKG